MVGKHTPCDADQLVGEAVASRVFADEARQPAVARPVREPSDGEKSAH
jgi:hypothetical protein